MAEGAVRKGRRGEELAARHLEARGWTILARNWRDGPRELDLVAFREGVLAFVEVKARREPAWNDPLESLGPRKRAEVERAARAWLREEGARAARATTVRFDVALVRFRPGRPAGVEHLPDAWRPGWG
jgi:putative endonuclease